MHITLLPLGAALLYVAFWLAKRFIRKYIFKGPLENIPGPSSPSFITGNMLQCFNSHAMDFHREIAERYSGVIKLNGLLGDSILYVFDPKALQHIIGKDQYGYDKETNITKIIFGEGLLSTSGHQHKTQRKMLNPAFSNVHLKEIVPVFWEVSRKLRDALATQSKSGKKEIDIATWMARTSLEMIGQGGLGHSFDPLTEDASLHPYGIAINECIPAIARLIPFQSVFSILVKVGSPELRRWLVNISPFATINKIRDVVDIMHDTSVEILESRRKALIRGNENVQKHVAQGKDIMSILLKGNMRAAEEDQLPEDEVLAQITTMTLAGTETTAGTLSRILHLLCLYPDIQEKLREEIMAAGAANTAELSYDELRSLPYLDAVCRETLRLYAPLPQIHRTAMQGDVLPLSTALKGLDGQDIHEIYVPKGTSVFISLISANRNKFVWGEDAETFNPDRWLNTLPETVKNANIPGIYSHLMTFFGGARSCIGFKFSVLETKVVLVALLRSFKFSLSDKNIFWAMNSTFTPTVVGENTEIPSLPINISLI